MIIMIISLVSFPDSQYGIMQQAIVTTTTGLVVAFSHGDYVVTHVKTCHAWYKLDCLGPQSFAALRIMVLIPCEMFCWPFITDSAGTSLVSQALPTREGRIEGKGRAWENLSREKRRR